MDERQKYKRDGKLQQIRHDLNAQFLAAAKQLPAIAYKNKGLLFTTYREQTFPAGIGAKEIAFTWTLGTTAAEITKTDLFEAIKANDDARRIAILKRGATYFVIAAVALLLEQRNGKTFLSRLDEKSIASKSTVKKLRNYCKAALEWYVQTMSELLDSGKELPVLVRSQESWTTHCLPKIKSRYKLSNLAPKALNEMLPLM